MRDGTNRAASVRQRLLNRARSEGEDFQALLTRYALERFCTASAGPRTGNGSL